MLAVCRCAVTGALTVWFPVFDDLIELRPEQEDERRGVEVDHKEGDASQRPIGIAGAGKDVHVESEECREQQPQPNASERARAHPAQPLLDIRGEVVGEREGGEHRPNDHRPGSDPPDQLIAHAEAE